MEGPEGDADCRSCRAAMTADYYYDQSWRVAQESTTVDSVAVNTSYVWGLRRVDSPVCRITESYMLGETTHDAHSLYYMTDARGNVTGLVVGGPGEVVERYSYDANGVVTFMASDWSGQVVAGHADGTASAYGNEVLYSGYRFDAEVGGYQVRHREYLPGMGVWMQRDPLGYVDGMNDLEYVGGNDVSRVDPYGLQTSQAGSQPAASSRPAGASSLYIANDAGNKSVVTHNFKDSPVVGVGTSDVHPQDMTINVITRQIEEQLEKAGPDASITEVHVMGHTTTGEPWARFGAGRMFYDPKANLSNDDRAKEELSIDLGDKDVQDAIRKLDTLLHHPKWYFEGCKGDTKEHRALYEQFATIISRDVTAYKEYTKRNFANGNLQAVEQQTTLGLDGKPTTQDVILRDPPTPITISPRKPN